MTIEGVSFGTNPDEIDMTFDGPIESCLRNSISVTDTQLVCVAQSLRADPDVSSGPIRVLVSRGGGASLGGRGTTVATMIPQHNVSVSAFPFPANGRKLIVHGKNFPVQFATSLGSSLSVTVAAGA